MRAHTGRRVDRRIAAGVCVLAAVGLAVTAFGSQVPSRPTARDDAGAALELFRTLQDGEHVDHIVDFAFTRTDAGRAPFTSPVTEARYGRAVFLRGGSSLTVTVPGAAYDCIDVDGQGSCARRTDKGTLPPSIGVGADLASGNYEAAGAARETFAGERARCFVLRRRAGVDASLPLEITICVSTDGLVLRRRTVSALASDEWVATRVVRNVDDAALAPLLEGFEPAATHAAR